jgi:signal transduction histidine kinase
MRNDAHAMELRPPIEGGIGSASLAAAATLPVTAQGKTRRAGRAFDLALLLLTELLTVVTAVVLFVPGFSIAVIAPGLDDVINTAATLSAGGIALLAWIRFRETRQLDALYHASAFLALFVGGAIGLGLLLSHADVPLGFSHTAPGQAPLYLWTLQRATAAGLLVMGGLAVLRGWTVPTRRSVVAVSLGPTAALISAAALILAFARQLPALVPQATLDLSTRPIDRLDAALLSAPMITLQLAVAALCLGGAVAYVRIHRMRGANHRFSAYLAAALVIAAFSQLHSAVVSGTYDGIVASADVLRLAFYGLMLIAVADEARRDLIALREANANLVRLRAEDSARAATEERARLAREIHDGLVQELWLARLTNGQLAHAKRIPAQAREVIARVDEILEGALAEARQAVAALQPVQSSTLGEELSGLAEDFADHFGLEIEFSLDNDPGQLPGAVQSEVVRICREALNNVRKHADASVVRIRLLADDTDIRLMVADNGKGFDLASETAGFGLQGMRQRAQSIGGWLSVESQLLDGTKVIFGMPLPGSK